jgi:membrane protein DedA with SNARE-associated domain
VHPIKTVCAVHWIYESIRYYLVHWGYWAVLIGLLGEDAGLPLPGETVLLFASFLAHKTHQLGLIWVILVGIAAATMGDNLGFLLGRRFGKTLLRWLRKLFRLSETDIRAAKDLIKRRGATTVFWARYIFGLRTVAGPLAGMLEMPWKRFWLFNFLGAVSWVALISIAGYFFANEFQTMLSYFETAGWALAAFLFALGYFLWWRHKKKFEQKTETQSET